MTRIRYEAFTSTGQRSVGVLEAESVSSALQSLKQQGLSAYRAELADDAIPKPGSHRFKFGAGDTKWRADLCRQLATLLASGITIDRGLRLLLVTSRSKTATTFLKEVLEKVTGGKSLSQALSTGSRPFPPDEVGIIRAAEQSGRIVTGLEELATLLIKRAQFRSNLTSSLLYPAFLLALAPVSLVFIGTILVPNLAPIFEGSGAPMPFVLRLMTGVSDLINGYWPVLLAAISAIVAAIYVFRSRIGSALRDLWRRLPIAGKIVRKLELIRIARTLGMLIKAGNPLQLALTQTRAALSAQAVQDSIGLAERAVAGGQRLASALKHVKCFDETTRQMIAVGEESNTVDAMLLYIAEGEERTLAAYLERITTFASPLMTLVMGLLIGGLVISIMRAILSVNELALK
jgi:general secretion pathway protein F